MLTLACGDLWTRTKDKMERKKGRKDTTMKRAGDEKKKLRRKWKKEEKKHSKILITFPYITARIVN